MTGYPDITEIKAWLNITGTTDDVFLQHKLDVSISMLERYTNRTFPKALRTEKFYSARCGQGGIKILYPKAVPIINVHGVSAHGWQQLGYGAICLPGSSSCFTEAGPQTVVVEYEGGFDPIPPEILDVIYGMMGVAHASKGTVISNAGQIKSETVFGVAKTDYVVDSDGSDSGGGKDPALPSYYSGILDSYILRIT